MIPIFPYIQADHPFYPLIERLREAVRSSRYAAQIAQMTETKKTIIRADLSQTFEPGSGWDLKKFYWSFQYWDGLDASKFHAITFYYTSKEEDILHSCQFPADPFLESVERFFLKRSSFEMNANCSAENKVLQYTPFRRLAVSVAGERADETADDTSLVCKFKKRSRYQLAYEKLVHVFETSRQSPLSFSLAAPLKIDHKNAVFFQEAKKGKDLSQTINASNFKRLTENLGALHYDLQQLCVRSMPEFNFPVFLNELKKNISWIICFCPEQVELFNSVRETLVENPPALDTIQFSFCHGDFVCSQILIDGDEWSVIDFDLAMYGDPYLEIGRLVASLKYDVPFFNQEVTPSDHAQNSVLNEAIESYLSAYEKRADKPLSHRRLLWYQMWYEVFYLSLMFKKDRFDPGCYTYASQSLVELRTTFLNMKN